jgi:acetyl-CoA synthetase
MLACARIGAIHSVVFCRIFIYCCSNRINESTPNGDHSDGGYRGNKTIELKEIIDEF